MLRILILILFPLGIVAQGLQLSWFTQSDHFVIHCSKMDANGDIIVGGSFSGTVDFDHGPHKREYTAVNLSKDAFVAKYDAYGNLKWVATYGNNNPDVVLALDIGPNGNIYAVGEFTGRQDMDPGPGNFFVSVNGYVDVLLWILSPHGSLIDAKAFGGRSYESPHSISVQKDGYVAIGGFFWGDPDMDPTNAVAQIISNGQSDGFVMKISPNGAVQWAKNYGTTTTDQIRAVFIDDQQKTHIMGYTGPNTDFDPHPILVRYLPGGAAGGYLLTLDSVGDIEDLYHTGIAPQQMLVSDQGYFFSGHFTGSFDFNPDTTLAYTLNAVGNQTPLYAWHLSPNFQFKFARAWNNAEMQGHSLSLSPSPEKGIILSGVFEDSIDVDPTAFNDIRSSQGWRDLFVCHLDSLGNYAYGHAWGSSSVDIPYYALMNPAGELYVGGRFSDRMDFDPAPSIFDYGHPLGPETFMLKLTYCQEVIAHDTIEACNEYTWINKYTYNDNHSGDRYIVRSPSGCDSLIYLHLTMHFISNEVTVRDSLFTAVQPLAFYQWINCLDSNRAIAGAINRSFIPDSGGIYAVVVQKGICTDTSACIPFGRYVSLSEESLPEVSIYPNPSSGQYHIEMDENVHHFKWQVHDLQGRLLLEGHHPNDQALQIEIDKPSGIYLLYLESEGQVQHFKLVKR